MFNNPLSEAKGFVLGKKFLAVFLSFSLIFSFLTIPSQEALAEVDTAKTASVAETKILGSCHVDHYIFSTRQDLDASGNVLETYMFIEEAPTGTKTGGFGIEYWELEKRTEIQTIKLQEGLETVEFIGTTSLSVNRDNGPVTYARKYGLFEGCVLTNIDALAKWKVDNITDMCYMFSGWKLLDLTPLASWNMSSVTDISGMFYNFPITDFSFMASWNLSSYETGFSYPGDFNFVWNSDYYIKKVGVPVNMPSFFDEISGGNLAPHVNWKYKAEDAKLYSLIEAKANYSKLAGTVLELVEVPPNKGTIVGESIELSDTITEKKLRVKVRGDDIDYDIPVEIKPSGSVYLTLPDSNFPWIGTYIPGYVYVESGELEKYSPNWEAVAGRDIVILDKTGNVIASGKTSTDGYFSFPSSSTDTDSGSGTTEPETRKVRVSSFSGNGTLKINGANVSAAEDVSISSEEAMTVSWQASAGTASVDNVSLMTSLSIDGQSVDVSNIDKTKWQVANTAYESKMNETGAKMTTLDAVKAAEQTVTIPASTLASLAATSSSEVSIEVQFSEYVPVYRLYNQITSEHLFTTNKTEYDTFVQKCESGEDVWIGEGIDWFAEVTPETANDNTVRRFYNAALGAMGSSSHYYSKDATEIATLLQNGWVDDGPANYIQSGGDVPIWTCYNEALGSAHHYTSNKTEWEGLEQNGWALEKDKNGVSPVKTLQGAFQAVMSARP